MAIAAALIALGFAQPSIALPGLAPSTPAKVGKVKHDPCLGHDTTAKQAAPFIEKVWRLIYWRRDKPKPSTVRAYRDKLRCAGPENRKALKHRWGEARRAFYKHRRAELWRIRVTPFYGGGGWWSIPWEFVSCESGGDYYPDFGFAYGGAYGLIPPTWLNYGGGAYASQANYATERQQDLIAHKVWVDVGEAAWRPFEGGCS